MQPFTVGSDVQTARVMTRVIDFAETNSGSLQKYFWPLRTHFPALKSHFSHFGGDSAAAR
jgi:hypothetical protein